MNKPVEKDGASKPATGKDKGSGGPKPLPEKKITVRPTARPARRKTRHWGILLSFMIIVLLPIGGSGWYLYTKAADQYAATIGFTARSAEGPNATDLLSGLGSSLTGGSASSDADILYKFILSQEIVRTIDTKLDLVEMYARHADVDPLLSYSGDATIEDLTRYWQRMVRVAYDSASGLMELRVLAFSPQDAQDIANAIQDESSRMINALSASAQEDATRYARADLDLALERLKNAREALTAFRLTNQIVDPNADIQTQVGLLANLQAQQATALIDYQLLQDSVRDGDPRLETARKRLEIIEAQIEVERQKFGASGASAGGQDYATVISDFERLTADREYAETAYAASLSALDAARADAGRQSRYLAVFIRPTLAEKSEFPQRPLLIALVGAFCFLIWAILSLVFYALRDRK